jgi:hypothetical protein
MRKSTLQEIAFFYLQGSPLKVICRHRLRPVPLGAGMAQGGRSYLMKLVFYGEYFIKK